MPLYMYRAAYAPKTLAALIQEPHDRIEVLRPTLEAIGVKILAGGYPFGQYDVLVVYEAPDDTTAASVAITIGAGGAVKSAETIRLLSGQEWIKSLQQAHDFDYQPMQ